MQDNRDKVMPIVEAQFATFSQRWAAGKQRDADWHVHTAIVETLQQRMAEVRRRVIIDFYDGTGEGAGHWSTCRLCDWSWRYNDPELHEPTCPIKETP